MKRLFDVRRFQHVLGIAGMINIVAGILFIIYPALFYKMFFNPELFNEFSSLAVSNILSLNLWSFVLIMGFGYIWASQAPIKNRLFIFVGALGKIAAALSWIFAYANGAGLILLLFGAFTEIVFALLFLGFYFSSKKQDVN